jgi:tetratricopeptide (TPR) repeat protein
VTKRSHPSVSARHQQPRAPAIERAALALRAGQLADAEQLATEALRRDRMNIPAIRILAGALLAQNRGGEAITPLQEASRRDSDPGIEILLGAALGNAGRHAEAIEQLRRSAARRPPVLPAFQELAGQFVKTGRIDEAIATIQSGLELAPEAIDLQLDLARLHLQQNDRRNARSILLKARDAAPDRREILIELGRVLLLDGDYAAAADAYRHALAYFPDDALTRADLAACFLEMGDRSAGEASLRSAFRSGPHMLGRSIHALVASSHGRFFFRPSAVVKFLQG